MRLVGRVWAVLGVACFISFLVLVTRIEDRQTRLVSEGVRTSALVLEDPPTALRCGPVPVSVQFVVDGVPQVQFTS